MGSVATTRQGKTAIIGEVKTRFDRATSAVLLDYKGMTVETATKLRASFRKAGVEYKVIKNTLAKRAAKGTALEQVSDDFTGPVALCLSYGDVVAPAKILTDFIKDLETIKVRSGVIDGKKISASEVKALAKLPGINELRARILGVIMQPATKVARTISAPGSQLARVIAARAEALGKQG